MNKFLKQTIYHTLEWAELFTKKKEKRNKLEVEIERIHVIIKIVCNPVSKKQVLSKNIPETFWKERFAG